MIHAATALFLTFMTAKIGISRVLTARPIRVETVVCRRVYAWFNLRHHSGWHPVVASRPQMTTTNHTSNFPGRHYFQILARLASESWYTARFARNSPPNMSSNTLNYPLLAIPAYYLFSVVPHMYATSLLASHGYKHNNANPKASLSPSAIQGKVPDAVFQKYQRAENAQSNNLESLPLFAAAILSSIIAERATVKGLGDSVRGQDATGLQTFIGAWFAIRAVYTVAYVQIDDHTKSFFRSVVYASGVGLAVYQFYKAAQLLG